MLNRMIKKIFLFFFVFLFLFGFISAIVPFGANLTEVRSETSSPDAPQSVSAQAGNVTELNIFGYSVTRFWQGYFGNVSGTIQLADSGDNVMYNWSLASPEGEIYASLNDSISWQDVQCFNFSATGDYLDDSANAGATSLYGLNLTQLESSFNIPSDSVDGVDETFSFFGVGTHDLFYTNSLEFSEGECRSTRVYGDSGSGESDEFEEILLYDPGARSVIFTTILEQDVLGFDSGSHDFEMMVLEDGSGTDVAVTPYYFYVELQ